MDTHHTNRLRFRRIEKSAFAAADAAHRAAEDRISVLLVDDDDNVRKVLSRMLSDMDFNVITARDGKEGLRLFIESPYDIVLTDWNMPRMDGLSMARHIKVVSPHTPIILITGENRNHRMLQGGHVDTVLFKPFQMGVLEKMVQKILN